MSSPTELWAEAWLDVPWDEASPEDRQMFIDHADSLRWWKESKNG